MFPEEFITLRILFTIEDSGGITAPYMTEFMNQGTIQ